MKNCKTTLKLERLDEGDTIEDSNSKCN